MKISNPQVMSKRKVHVFTPCICLTCLVSAGLLLNTFRSSLTQDELAKVPKLSDLDTAFVAFSKGCCILNQLVKHEAKQKRDNHSYVSRLRMKKLVYLDSGHNGSELFYPIEQHCVDFIRDLSIPVEVWVSPYQMMPPNKSAPIKSKIWPLPSVIS